QVNEYQDVLKSLVYQSNNLLETLKNLDFSKNWSEIPEDVEDFPVYTLDIKSRFINDLQDNGYEYLMDLHGVIEDELTNERGIGNKLVESLKSELTRVRDNPDHLKRSIFEAALEWKENKESWRWDIVRLSVSENMTRRAVKDELEVDTSRQTVDNVVTDFFQFVKQKGYFQKARLESELNNLITNRVRPIKKEDISKHFVEEYFDEMDEEFQFLILDNVFEEIPFEHEGYSRSVPEALESIERKIHETLQENVYPIHSSEIYRKHFENDVPFWVLIELLSSIKNKMSGFYEPALCTLHIGPVNCWRKKKEASPMRN
ncbi:MAG: hypothetical protein ABEH43_06550, partial [Flavobacteriales bacterium]